MVQRSGVVNDSDVFEIVAHFGCDLGRFRPALFFAGFFETAAQSLQMDESVRTANALPSVREPTDELEVPARQGVFDLNEFIPAVLQE